MEFFFMFIGLGFFIFIILMVLHESDKSYHRSIMEAREFGFQKQKRKDRKDFLNKT
jgi:hypothetical protein